MMVEPQLATDYSWFLILIAAGAVVAGVSIATILMGNRHTRGIVKAMLLLLACAVGTMVMFRFYYSATELATELTSAETADTILQQKLSESSERRAAQLERMAIKVEQIGGKNSSEIAADFRQKAEELRQAPIHTSQATHSSSPVTYASHVTYGSRKTLLFPVIGLVFLGVVFMLFKHAGPGVGFAALAVPVALMFWFYAGVHEMSATPQEYVSELGTSTHGHGSPPSFEMPLLAEVDSSEEFDVLDGKEAGDPAASPAEAAEVKQPKWVDNPPKSVPNVYRRVVESSWYDKPDTCRQKVDQLTYQAVNDYLQQLANAETKSSRAYIPSLEKLGITSQFVRENLVSDEFYETRDFELDSEMQNLHLLLEFDSTDTDFLLGQWRQYARQGRIAATAVGMGGVLAALAGVLGLIKLDTYTKGYYTKRLFIGVPAAIIGAILLISLNS